MDLLVGILGVVLTLFITIYKGYFIGYALILCLLIFIVIGMNRGYSLKNLLWMAFKGGSKSFVVLKIFLLIGIITSIWISSGTVPGIVCYGMKYMNLDFFILYVFLITCLVSFLLGTSLGTVSTVGIAFIVMAKGGGVDPDITAGAIISGAYFGDRISPMSSSANLVATLTKTELYGNIKNMFRTGNMAFISCIIIYGVLSYYNPLDIVKSDLVPQIYKSFEISPVVLIPTLIILIFSIFKIDVKISMAVSIVIAFFLSIFTQGYTPTEIFYFVITGFHLEKIDPLYKIIKGGGILAMGKAGLVVFISCAMTGIFEETAMLNSIERILEKARSRTKIFIYTNIVSFFTAAIGSNQSISVVLTSQLMEKVYKKSGINKEDFAIDLENTSIVLAPLIPWNIAALIPTTTMMVSSYGYIPYAYFLFLIPLLNLLTLKKKQYKIVALSK